MGYPAISCQFLIGGVFVASALTKLLGPSAFRAFVRSVRRMTALPTSLVRPAAVGTVSAEVAVPVLLALPVPGASLAGLALAIGLLLVFTAVILRSIRRGQRTPCRCFGTSTVPLGPRHVARNAFLVAVAALGLVALGTGGRLPPVQLAVAAVVGLVLAGLVAALDDLAALFRPASTSSRPGPGVH